MARLELNIARAFNNIADLLAFTAAFFLGCATHQFTHPEQVFYIRFDERVIGMAFVVFYALNEFSLFLTGAYPIRRLRKFAEKSRLYLNSVLLALFIMIILAYAIYPNALSRTILFSSAFFAYVLLLVKEAVIRAAFRRIRKKGENIRRVIIVAREESAILPVISEIERDHYLGMKVVGVITPFTEPVSVMAGRPILGTIADIGTIIEKNIIDCVIFLSPVREDKPLEDAIWKCQQLGIEIWIKLAFLDASIGSMGLEHITKMPFLNLRSGPQNATAIIVKYAMDRVVSAVLLTVLSPVFLIVAIAVKLSSPGPVFFKQTRATINGRKFSFYKFRSMRQDAEAIKDTLRHRNEMSGPVFKIKDDPRITPVGKFIRKYSLDELPQLWNVLKGDMSLVGPRPLPIEEVERISGWQRRRLTMKPGLTCIWQVSGRNNIRNFDDWARLDLNYIDEWTLWLDIKLLLKTVPAVFSRSGV